MMGSLRFLPQTSCPKCLESGDPLPTLPSLQSPALESYLSSRDSEGFSSSLSLLLGRLLGRRGRFCPKCWVIGRRCCRRSERLVREGALKEPPLCRPESPS